MKKTVLLAAALALLALSCGEEESITRPPVVYFPADVLENVETSFDQRDIDTLKKCLSRDFVFYFDPDDVGQSPPGSRFIIPESWSYTEFWKATNNMLQSAYAISLDIPTGRVGTPGENETTYEAENVPLSLLVMIDDLNGFIAERGYCNFAFKAYRNEKNEKVWRLVGWWDYTSVYADGSPGLVPMSLGKILATYK